MTVYISSAYGLLVLRNERTQEFLEEHRAKLAMWAASVVFDCRSNLIARYGSNALLPSEPEPNGANCPCD